MPHVSFIGNEEQRLVKRLQEGDKTAASEFYARYGGSLVGVCVRYIADEEDVKDVIQNALVHPSPPTYALRSLVTLSA